MHDFTRLVMKRASDGDMGGKLKIPSEFELKRQLSPPEVYAWFGELGDSGWR